MPVFSHPAAAWLLPAIVLPIIFHLFFRMRRQTRDFPALLFFQRIDPRLSSKRKLHEWVILFLRCLFIALLIAALLRPLLGVHQSSGSVARVVLIDNSASMAGQARPGLSKWTLAKDATLHLISAQLPGDTLVVQLTVPDPTAALPNDFDATAASLRDAVSKLVVSDGAGSMPKALRRALATLDDAKASRRELIVLTDLQRDNWTRGELGSLPTTSHVVVRRLPSVPPTSGAASFQSMELPTRAIPAGRITPLRIELRNEGGGEANARLNSSDDSGRNQTRDLDLATRASANATLAFSFATAGFHWAELWIEGDAAPAAIRSELGFWCTDVRKVLFVGTHDDFGALPYAVSPGGNADLTGLESVFIDPGQVATSLADKPLAVVTSWDRVDPALEDYVRNGGTLLLVPRATAGSGTPPPAWINAALGAAHTATDPEPVLLLKEDDAAWHDLRDSSGRPQFGTLRVWQYQPVQATGSDWQALVASGHGATLLTRRELGRGHILASGLAFAPKESSLPLKAGFVVMMQNLIFGDRSEPVPVRMIHAGDDITLPSGNVSIKSLAGSALSWQGAARDFAGFPRAGVYEIRQPNHVEWIAASGDPEEAQPDFLPLGPIALLRDLPHDIAALNTAEELTRLDASPATTSSFYRWLLLAALLVLLGETWLAHQRSSDLGGKWFKSLRKESDPAKPPSAPKKAAVKVKAVKVTKPKVVKPKIVKVKVKK
jgi:hypothetical protein